MNGCLRAGLGSFWDVNFFNTAIRNRLGSYFQEGFQLSKLFRHVYDLGKERHVHFFVFCSRAISPPHTHTLLQPYAESMFNLFKAR